MEQEGEMIETENLIIICITIIVVVLIIWA